MTVWGAATGGNGGEGPERAGNGGSVSLVNAVDGQTAGELNLTQSATGGNGGTLRGTGSIVRRRPGREGREPAHRQQGGRQVEPCKLCQRRRRGRSTGGSGGNGTARADGTNTGDVTVMTNARGGRGDSYNFLSPGGQGGDAAATATGTSWGGGNVEVNGSAYGGEGGLGEEGGGKGGTATATATGTSAGSGGVTVNASAFGGNGGPIFPAYYTGGLGGVATAKGTGTSSGSGDVTVIASASGGIGGYGGWGDDFGNGCNGGVRGAMPQPRRRGRLRAPERFGYRLWLLAGKEAVAAKEAITTVAIITTMAMAAMAVRGAMPQLRRRGRLRAPERFGYRLWLLAGKEAVAAKAVPAATTATPARAVKPRPRPPEHLRAAATSRPLPQLPASPAASRPRRPATWQTVILSGPKQPLLSPTARVKRQPAPMWASRSWILPRRKASRRQLSGRRCRTRAVSMDSWPRVRQSRQPLPETGPSWAMGSWVGAPRAVSH